MFNECPAPARGTLMFVGIVLFFGFWCLAGLAFRAAVLGIKTVLVMVFFAMLLGLALCSAMHGI